MTKVPWQKPCPGMERYAPAARYGLENYVYLGLPPAQTVDEDYPEDDTCIISLSLSLSIYIYIYTHI